jgi:hypothetical protein
MPSRNSRQRISGTHPHSNRCFNLISPYSERSWRLFVPWPPPFVSNWPSRPTSTRPSPAFLPASPAEGDGEMGSAKQVTLELPRTYHVPDATPYEEANRRLRRQRVLPYPKRALAKRFVEWASWIQLGAQLPIFGKASKVESLPARRQHAKQKRAWSSSHVLASDQAHSLASLFLPEAQGETSLRPNVETSIVSARSRVATRAVLSIRKHRPAISSPTTKCQMR